MSSSRLLFVGVASVGTLYSTAQELPTCDELGLPNAVFGAGASTLTPLLAAIAPTLLVADEPTTLLYADVGACVGLDALSDATPLGLFKYWDSEGLQLSCARPTNLEHVDFAYAADVTATCPERTVPESLGRFPASIQVLQVLTSIDSDETSISREALYFAYGWGDASQAPPWTDEASLFKRRLDSHIHQAFAASIGLPVDKFLGTSSDDVAEDIVVAAATNAGSTLGYATRSVARGPANAVLVKSLAYQHTGQDCGYWPDLGPDTYDAVNVRTGLYQLWSPSHLYARLDAEGVVVNAQVRSLLDWFAGVESPTGNEVIEATITAGDIPTCAMQVTREGFAGAVSSAAPDEPCGCLFELLSTGATTCESCETDASCDGAGKCRRKLCEAY